MARVEMLRELMNERLAVVVEEICGLFRSTIAEYEDRVRRSTAEAELLRAALREREHSADIQQVLVIKEEQQEWSQDQNALQPLHIKKEEPWSSQEGQHVEEPKKSPFPVDLGKSESEEGTDTQLLIDTKQSPSEHQEQQHSLKDEDLRPPPIIENQEPTCSPMEEDVKGAEDNPQAESPASRSTQQMETDGKGCGRAEAASRSGCAKTSNSSDCETEDSDDDDWKRMPRQQSNLKLMQNTQGPGSEPVKELVSNGDLKPANEETSDTSETEDSDDDWKHSRKPHLGLPTIKPKEVPESSSEFSCQTVKTSSSCPVCGKRFQLEQQLKKHTKTHPQAATCGKLFSRVANLREHASSHSPEKLLNSSASNKCKDRTSLKRGRTKQFEEKTCPCSICDKIFKKKADLILHMKMHKVGGKRRTTHTRGNSK